ncbi:unnamed protein product [Ostreobium quekettii]|uniref:Uncharacterized protein n=1 Tax=Ostreobium quekettii TaxID=121088 RepID=A0A8S1IVQ0_9CHLO|nr:unnamed protein product [Ostreobium quekettii]|eukprot:evm.model.scf_467.4 EVM.evm.TU.scf_467.4   scf_467:41139-45378(-)
MCKHLDKCDPCGFGAFLSNMALILRSKASIAAFHTSVWGRAAGEMPDKVLLAFLMATLPCRAGARSSDGTIRSPHKPALTHWAIGRPYYAVGPTWVMAGAAAIENKCWARGCCRYPGACIESAEFADAVSHCHRLHTQTAATEHFEVLCGVVAGASKTSTAIRLPKKSRAEICALSMAWDGIQQQIDQCGSSIDFSIIAAAFRLAQKSRHAVPAGILGYLTGLVVKKSPMQRCKIRNVVSILDSCARMGYVNNSLLEVLASRVQMRSRKVDRPAMVSMMRSMAILHKTGARGDSKADQWQCADGGSMPTADAGALKPQPGLLFDGQLQFVEWLWRLAGLPRTLPCFKEGELCVLLHSLGQIGPLASNGLARPLLESLIGSGRLDAFRPNSLSIIIYSMSRLGLADGHLLRPLVERVAVRKSLEAMPLEGLSPLVYALGQLGWDDPKTSAKVLSEVVRPERLAHLSAWDLSSVWHGLANLGLRDPVYLAPLGREAAKPARAASLTEQGLSVTIGAAGRLRYDEPRFLDAMLSEATKPARLAGMRQLGACQIVAGISCLGTAQTAGLEDRMLAIVSEMVRPERVAACGLRDLCSVMYGLSRWAPGGGPELGTVLGRLRECVEAGGLDDLTEVDMALLIRGLRGHRVADRQLWRRLGEEAGREARLRRCSDFGLANLLRLMGSEPGANAGAAAKVLGEATRMERLAGCTGAGLCGIVGAIAGLKISDPGALARLSGELSRPERVSGLSNGELAKQVLGLLTMISRAESGGGLDQAAGPWAALVALLAEGSSPVRCYAMNGKELASMLYGLSRLPAEVSQGLDTHRAFNALVSCVLRDGVLDSMPGRYVAMAAEAIGRSIPTRGRDAALARVARQALIPGRLARMSPRDVSRLALGAALGGLADPPVLGALADAASSPDGADPRDHGWLASSLHSFARLGYAHAGLLAAASARLAGPGVAAAMTDARLASVLWSLGRFLHRDPSLLDAIVDEIFKRDRARVFGDGRLATAARALGRLGYRGPSAGRFLDSVADPRRLPRLPGPLLASLAYALAELAPMGDRLAVGVTAELAVPGRAADLSWRQLASVLGRVHLLGPDPTRRDALIAALVREVWDRVRGPRDLPQSALLPILGALGAAQAAGAIPGRVKSVAEDIADVAIGAGINSPDPAALFVAAAEGGLLAGERAEAALSAICRSGGLERCGSRRLARLAGAMAALGMRRDRLVSAVVSEAGRPRRAGRFGGEEAAQLVAGLRGLGVGEERLRRLSQWVVRQGAGRRAGTQTGDL